jgi:predicted nucleotidyltransferase
VHALIESRRSQVADICRRYGVARLELFGSAVGKEFDEETSDLDILVTFRQEAKRRAFDNFFGLRESLEALFARPVDLVTAESVRNPYLAREIEARRQILYAAQT